MNRFLTILVLTMTALAGANAQGFYGVHSPDGNSVWAVGKSGAIWRSTNGGAAWQNFSQGAATLRGVFTYGSTIEIVGDNGTHVRSADGGSSWTTDILGTGVSLRAVTMSGAETGWIVGDNGLILRTDDAGATWTTVTSGTSSNLLAVATKGSSTIVVTGASGTIRRSTDGGVNWHTMAVSDWTEDVLTVSIRDTMVYVAGRKGGCYRASLENIVWTPLNFVTESKADIMDVHAISKDTVVFTGGGGFIRTTTNAGQTFGYGTHQMHARLNDVFFYNNLKGWACSEKNNAILRTTDGGATWQLPTGTTVNYSWQSKLSGSSIGSTFMINPVNPKHIYVVLGSTVYMSANEGENWYNVSSVTSGGSAHSFYISPKDTNIWIAAMAGGSDRIMRSTNHGQSWYQTIARGFTSYGMPIEMNPSNTDEILFMPDGTSGANGVVYKSGDFGATWDTLAQTRFRSPCDIVYVPDSLDVLYVGDGVTGSGLAVMWRSWDGGVHWDSIYSNSAASEIPMICISPLSPNRAFSTAWSSTGGQYGGFMRTTNFGRNWHQVATTNSTWGADIARDDPNVVLYGTYGGSTSYLSTNGGNSFMSSALSGSNSGLLCYDRSLFLAQQTGGVSKYLITYTVPVTNGQALTVTSPNGGENWQYGTTHDITWNAFGTGNVRIEYKTTPSGAYQTIAASVPGSAGMYTWAIPNVKTTQARVRIAEASDNSPIDSSNANFTLSVAEITSNRTAIQFGMVGVGEMKTDTIRITNTGTAPLVISDITTQSAAFAVSRHSFTVAAGASDTLTIIFAPLVGATAVDTLSLDANAPIDPYRVALHGEGVTSAAVSVMSPNGGEVWTAGSLRTIQWDAALMSDVEIWLQTDPSSGWSLVAASVPAASESMEWLVPYLPSATAKIRVTSMGGAAPADSSDGVFTISASQLVTSGMIDFGVVTTGQSASDTLHIENNGTLDLTLTQITVADTNFAVSRASMTIPAGHSDTLTVWFMPAVSGNHQADLVLVSNAQSSPDTVILMGSSEIVGIDDGAGRPLTYRLSQNAPNPFNPTTEIAYEIPNAGLVQLKVYNALGQEVATLVNEHKAPGRYTARFSTENAKGSALSSGVYFYRLQSGTFVQTRKMTLVK